MSSPTIEDIVTAMVVDAGLSKEDESTQMLVGNLVNLLQFQASLIELQCRINEIELSLTQKNRMLYGTEVQPDIGNRQLIDPNVLMLRLQGLRKKEKQLRGSK
jgi:hypothetical protein